MIKCDNCAIPIEEKSAIIYVNNEQVNHICRRCSSMSGTCGFCKTGNECRFELDHSINLPKQVQQQISRNGGIFITTIKNPERIKVTCQAGCACYDEENGCLKEYGTCGRYEQKWLG